MAHTGVVRSDGRGLVGGTELGGDALLGPCGDDDYGDLAPHVSVFIDLFMPSKVKS